MIIQNHKKKQLILILVFKKITGIATQSFLTISLCSGKFQGAADGLIMMSPIDTHPFYASVLLSVCHFTPSDWIPAREAVSVVDQSGRLFSVG